MARSRPGVRRPTIGLAPAALLGLLAAAFMAPSARADEGAAADAVLIASLREDALAYEHGRGVAKDGLRAAELYCQAAKLGDAASQYDLGWMYAHGRGVPRDDALAAFFFHAAAEQGVTQAKTMLRQVGDPPWALPDCMRDPVVALPPPPADDAPPVPREVPAPKPIADLVAKLAPEFQVPPPLALAIIQAESNFDAQAVSPKNAQGLMQLIPETAARFRVKNPFDAKQNVRGGLAYLRWLMAYFEGDIALVAAAYNAGERTVERYGGVPPYGETRAYVRRILERLGVTWQPFDASVTEPSPLLAARPRSGLRTTSAR